MSVPCPECLSLPSPRPAAGLGPSPPTGEREKLLAAVVDLCEGSAAAHRPHARQMLGEVFLRLVSDAEHDIRVRLAQRLAEADWPPRALMAALALDDIDIARPVIAGSPVLEDEDLLAVITRATLEHQIAVAERPDLSPRVVNGLLSAGEHSALVALTANARLHIADDAMVRLVAAARTVAALRAPLARRPELSAELARGLYAWVGATLRRTLAERFELDPAWLDLPVSAATAEAFAAGPSARAELASERQESETRLVAKLEGSGQLKPGYLLRVLREGHLPLFEAALATLLGASRAQVRRALAGGTPRLLAFACVGVGIDRSAFPTVLTLVRSLNGGRPGDAPGSAQAVAEAFMRPDQVAATARFLDLTRDGA